MKHTNNHNQTCFGLGTIGRDMFYTTVSMFLMTYLTEVLQLPDKTLFMMTTMLLVMRIFDAVNDPFMGVIVDNTRSRFGKFKPWIVVGAVLGGIFMLLMFSDFGLTGVPYVLLMAVCYLMWDITYGLNDIAYWSMLPSLTLDQKKREKIGSFARICANIGMFAVVVLILPLTGMLGNAFDSAKTGWFVFACVVVFLMLGFQAITLFGVKGNTITFKQEEKTTLRDMFKALFHNDQLLYTAIAMALFMIGYCTTTSFGVYYFKYAYKNEAMYSVFAMILAISQLGALALFPLFSKRFSRKTLYTAATISVVIGYVVFFFSPMSMIYISIAGILIFVGQAFIQLLMLMFLADTIEYGQWKLGMRNESITFSVQPFINKIGGAIGTGIVGYTLVISGINEATPETVTAAGLFILKISMLVLPLLAIVAGYLVYRAKYKIDSTLYRKIVGELEARGDIGERGNA
ncbi:MAG: glycoside-pentoside-hexuronide (GPH):cation symporter [Clostridia bacterium]